MEKEKLQKLKDTLEEMQGHNRNIDTFNCLIYRKLEQIQTYKTKVENKSNKLTNEDILLMLYDTIEDIEHFINLCILQKDIIDAEHEQQEEVLTALFEEGTNKKEAKA